MVIPLLIIVAINLFFFILAFAKQTDKFTDFAYGTSFIAATIYLILANWQLPTSMILASGVVLVWGVRLVIYLFTRINKIKRDTRFDKMRKDPVKFGSFWALQTLSAYIILLPLIVIFTYSEVTRITTTFIIGIVVSIIGIIIESQADAQKFAFKNNPANKGKWIDTGWWRLSRHPNYFGEMLVWWGLFIALATFFTSMYMWLSVIGPISITVLLMYVSGIPMLEKKSDARYGENPQYQEYKRKTSILVPFPPAE